MNLSLPRKRVVLSLFGLLLVLSVVVGQFLFARMVNEERRLIVELRTRQRVLEADIQDKSSLLQAYKRTNAEIGAYRVTLPPDQVAFYSSVERELAKNGIQVNSMKPSKPVAGTSSVQVDFLGPYYSVLGVFSDWRGMGSAVRMISVSLEADEPGHVKGKMCIRDSGRGFPAFFISVQGRGLMLESFRFKGFHPCTEKKGGL